MKQDIESSSKESLVQREIADFFKLYTACFKFTFVGNPRTTILSFIFNTNLFVFTKNFVLVAVQLET